MASESASYGTCGKGYMALESASYGILNGYMASESALINTMLLGSVFGSVRFVPRCRFWVRFKPKNRARKNFKNRFQTRVKFDQEVTSK